MRLRALNGLLYKALTDLLCTPQVSQEICDLNVQLSKVDSGPSTLTGRGGQPGAGGEPRVGPEVLELRSPLSVTT